MPAHDRAQDRARVYLPTTTAGLAELRRAGHWPAVPGGRLGHAVTAAVREWYVTGDLEELEYSALIDAAESCLQLLAQDPQSPPRRVVVAVDVVPAAVRASGTTRSEVRVDGPLTLAEVASLHLDEDAADEVIRAAVQALPAAHGGDPDARFLLDEAQACDLLWYDVSELDQLP